MKKCRALLATLALLAGACDGGNAGIGAASESNARVIERNAGGLLELVPHAPERVAHAGLRRVTYEYEVAGQLRRLAYDERVRCDGQGHFALDLETLIEPRLDAAQFELFGELQAARSGFFFKYRDVRIRDVSLLLANYTVTALPAPAPVAGFECVELELRRRDRSGSLHRLAIEPRTGLVLRTIEEDDAGRVLVQTEFVELTLDPDLAGVRFHVDAHPWTPLARESELALAAHGPRLLPAGFRQSACDEVSVLDKRYVRRVYGDGLQHLFFLEARPIDDKREPAPAREEAHVRIFEVGPWRVAESTDGPRTLFLLGCAPENEILRSLQSSF